MNQLLSACGLLCIECPFFGKECAGCYQTEGKPFWSAELPTKICPLFHCAVNEKKLKNCGYCNELPCQKFYGLKDPNITEKEHLASITERTERLKKSIN